MPMCLPPANDDGIFKFTYRRLKTTENELSSIIILVLKLYWRKHIDGLVQHGNKSIANTLELLLSCTKPSICYYFLGVEVVNQ